MGHLNAPYRWPSFASVSLWRVDGAASEARRAMASDTGTVSRGPRRRDRRGAGRGSGRRRREAVAADSRRGRIRLPVGARRHSATHAPMRCCWRRLRAERPDDAVLSEEAPDNLARLRSDRVWIIDPVDGTREFSTPRREDWAVHIALWQRVGGPDGRITDAAVALPARDEVYRPTPSGLVARRDSGCAHPHHRQHPPAAARCCTGWPTAMDFEMVRIGSAGAKAMAVVRGDVDAYIHAGGQWEWDSAAPAGVVLAAGMHASRLDGSPMLYNRPDPYLPDLLMCRQELADVLLDAIRSAGGSGGIRLPIELDAMQSWSVAGRSGTAGTWSAAAALRQRRPAGPPGVARGRPPPCTSAASRPMTPPTSATPPPTWRST